MVRPVVVIADTHSNQASPKPSPKAIIGHVIASGASTNASAVITSASFACRWRGSSMRMASVPAAARSTTTTASRQAITPAPASTAAASGASVRTASASAS